MEHIENMKKMWSGSGKLLASEGDDSNSLEVHLSPRVWRVPREASESPNAIGDF
jgi:hypothetical protein